MTDIRVFEGGKPGELERIRVMAEKIKDLVYAEEDMTLSQAVGVLEVVKIEIIDEQLHG